jgi:hypothetical protein
MINMPTLMKTSMMPIWRDEIGRQDNTNDSSNDSGETTNRPFNPGERRKIWQRHWTATMT